MLREEHVQAVVVEANRIEQPGRRFDGAWRRIAHSRQRSDRLGNNAAQLRERNEGLHLTRISDGPRGDQDRIGQLQTVERDGQATHAKNFLRGSAYQPLSAGQTAWLPGAPSGTSRRDVA